MMSGVQWVRRKGAEHAVLGEGRRRPDRKSEGTRLLTRAPLLAAGATLLLVLHTLRRLYDGARPRRRFGTTMFLVWRGRHPLPARLLPLPLERALSPPLALLRSPMRRPATTGWQYPSNILLLLLQLLLLVLLVLVLALSSKPLPLVRRCPRYTFCPAAVAASMRFIVT